MKIRTIAGYRSKRKILLFIYNFTFRCKQKLAQSKLLESAEEKKLDNEE